MRQFLDWKDIALGTRGDTCCRGQFDYGTCFEKGIKILQWIANTVQSFQCLKGIRKKGGGGFTTLL